MPFAERLRTLDLGLLLMHPMPPSAMSAGGHAAEEEGREAVSEGLRQLRVEAAREQEWGRTPLLNPPVDASLGSGMTGATIMLQQAGGQQVMVKMDVDVASLGKSGGNIWDALGTML